MMETKKVAITDLKITGKIKLPKARGANKSRVIGSILVDNNLNVIEGAENIILALENGLETVEVQCGINQVSLKNNTIYGAHKILFKAHKGKR
jgi:hypothetical protein